ncbi:MAG: HAMP domain-containing sensor histidine kinase [Vagococcus sp.]|uniref:sensor histidine kinase n=1 Tax=Vagococcus sp. TaxID=1933889 RepID=UPI002FC5C427
MTKQTKTYLLKTMLIIVCSVIALYIIATKTIIGEGFGKVISDSFIIFQVVPDGGGETSMVNWLKFKTFIISIAVFAVVFVGFATYWISQYLLKKDRQYIATLLKQSLEDEDVPALDLEYLEIQNELEKIKLTNQKNQEALIQETQRTKDLVTFLAHDLRTPLASVIGYLNLLVDSPEIPVETRAKYLGIALDKAYRLEYLIDEFFDITRFNFQNIVLDYSVFDLSLLLQQLSEEFYPILQKKSQQLVMNMPEKCLIEADSTKLVRVLNNLLKNASAYGFEETNILLSVTIKEDKLQLLVKNQGNTIPPEKLTVIFDKFYRLDSARSTNSGGAGLGLAIAKEIVEVHEGSIEATSENQSTEFIVILPLKKQ